MRTSHLGVSFLIACVLAGCQSQPVAQVAPSLTQATPRVTSAPVATSGAASQTPGLKIFISAIEGGNDHSYRQPEPEQRGVELSPVDPHIDVVLQNTSSQPINVFQDWNSWGFNNLSLEITKLDGKVLSPPLVVKRGMGAWTMNFAEAQIIRPGEAIVREVHLYNPSLKVIKGDYHLPSGYYPEQLYGNFPFAKNSPRQMTMRAVFQNSSTDHQQYAAPTWTGKVTSPLGNYVTR
jgi:hypothetical protein